MELQQPIDKGEIPAILRQELQRRAMNAAESFANHGALFATLFFLGEAQIPEDERDRITLLAANVHSHNLDIIIHAPSLSEKEQQRQSFEKTEKAATDSIVEYLTFKQKLQTTTSGG
jgi:hypothetical protein